MQRAVLVALFLLIIAGGCSSGHLGSSLSYELQGEHYLKTGDLEQGEEAFSRAVVDDPHNPHANFFYARFLLAQGKHQKGMRYLKQAVELAPDKADYWFWLGVAYGESGMLEEEQTSYEHAVAIDRHHPQALTYLGNCRLRAGDFEAAFDRYQKALDAMPDNAQALYNRGLALRALGRKPEEKLAWRLYLDAFPAGSLAIHAADRLNVLGDHHYRNHSLGVRTLTLTDIAFQPFLADLSPASHPSLNLVGAVAANMAGRTLHVVVFQEGNIQLAKTRASSIADYLRRHFPALRQQGRVRTSWFGVAEQRTVMGTKLQIGESTRFFLTDIRSPVARRLKKQKIAQK